MRLSSGSLEGAPDKDGHAVTVRPAEPSDLELARSLGRSLFLVYGSYDAYMADWFQSPEVSTFVAELDGASAGLSMVRVHPATDETPPVAELLAIAVVPRLQSRGVGKALLETAIAAARRREPGASEIRLSVADGNSRARRMFARNGFRVQSGSGIYPAGQRAVFMVKTLAANP